LFEKAVTLFKNNKKDQFKFKELQDKLKDIDAIISELVADNIRLRKKTEWRKPTSQQVDPEIQNQIGCPLA